MQALRRLGLAGTELAKAQCNTVRLKLLKIGARFVSPYAKAGCRCRPAILTWIYFARCTGSCKLQLCAAEKEEVARPVALHNESGGMVCLSLTKNPNSRGEDGQQDRR
jgi:hypothetical protein